MIVTFMCRTRRAVTWLWIRVMALCTGRQRTRRMGSTGWSLQQTVSYISPVDAEVLLPSIDNRTYRAITIPVLLLQLAWLHVGCSKSPTKPDQPKGSLSRYVDWHGKEPRHWSGGGHNRPRFSSSDCTRLRSRSLAGVGRSHFRSRNSARPERSQEGCCLTAVTSFCFFQGRRYPARARQTVSAKKAGRRV